MLKKPRIFLQIICVSFVAGYASLLIANPVYSSLSTDIQSEIDQKNQELQEKQSILTTIEAKIKEISGSNYTVSQKVALIDEEMSNLNVSISQNNESIEKNAKEISEKELVINNIKYQLDRLSTDLYMQSRFRLSAFFFTDNSWENMVKDFFVKQNTISILKDNVEKISGDYDNLIQVKVTLDDQRIDLEAQKKDMDDAYALLAKEKADLQSQLNTQYAQKKAITTQIGGITKDLSSLQEYLIAINSGGTVVDAGSLISTSSTGSLAYFQSHAPSGKVSFGVFSFGAFTHRNGMSQWGAKARSDAGQSYSQILQFYYPGKQLKTGIVRTSTYGTEAITSTIKVSGYNNGNPISLEDTYLLGIHEIDSSWNNTDDMNVLKAQVIAARTYAINYTLNGRNTICSTESCQVFNGSALYPTSSAWAQAVRETKGMVLTDSSGYVFSAQFAAVHGGWVNNVGYDLKDGSSDWVSRAWENLSGVTWFYRNWYDYHKVDDTHYSYTPCSAHPNPWLTEEEMADILNAYKYWIQSGSPASDPRMVSVTVTACRGVAANPYSMSELRNLVNNPVKTISRVITVNKNGNTQSITFYTNAGTISFTNSGDYTISGFRKIFQLRSPGYYAIWQTGFTNINIERIQK